MERRLCIIWLLTFALCRRKGAYADTSFYTAGVVEFRPTVGGMSSSDLVADHLQSYINIIESSEANDTDIIVFPEGTLNNAFQLTFVPDSKDAIIPCLPNESNMYADFLVELSCAARRMHKYLVINLIEKENCSSVQFDPRPCASDDLNIYNTNVVFDREGRVVSRYRKVHVYEKKNTTYEPEYGIFDTDFGVRFGHFICFDMLFYTPAQELVERFGITDFIFTSQFFSELPFLTAVQLQHGWAWGNNVNLLAGGASFPQSGSTGSGIYTGSQGDLISVMVKGEGERKLYKARVPKNVHSLQRTRVPRSKSNSLQSAKIHMMKDPQITNYTSVLLDLTKPMNFSQQLCQGDLCCTFDISTENIESLTLNTTYYNYRVGVFNGRRTYEKEEWSDIKVCALYGCINDNVSSCGELLIAEQIEPKVIFKNISIRGSFTKSNRLLIMPTTIDDELYPLHKDAVYWHKSENHNSYDVDFFLTQDQSNVLTFGIYANYYDKSSAVSNGLINILKYPLLIFILLKTAFL